MRNKTVCEDCTQLRAELRLLAGPPNNVGCCTQSTVDVAATVRLDGWAGANLTGSTPI